MARQTRWLKNIRQAISTMFWPSDMAVSSTPEPSLKMVEVTSATTKAQHMKSISAATHERVFKSSAASAMTTSTNSDWPITYQLSPRFSQNGAAKVISPRRPATASEAPGATPITISDQAAQLMISRACRAEVIAPHQICAFRSMPPPPKRYQSLNAAGQQQAPCRRDAGRLGRSREGGG